MYILDQLLLDFGDEFDKTGKRAARGEDGKTSYVPADMTYQKWKEKYVVEARPAFASDSSGASSIILC